MGGPHGAAVAQGCPGHAAGGRALTASPLLVAERPHAAKPAPTRALRGPERPAGLLALSDAPACVWVEGAPLPALERCVALVGSRAASPYGLAMAGRLARDLGAVGIAIVSGLARGIDAAAHRGAIAAGAATIAVVPCGLDTAAAIADPGLHALVRRHGTLLSEVPSGPPFGRGAFVRRNRLIAALAAVTVVVEAAERSGALSTAAAAARLGRARGAVPGDLDRPTARGVLALLRAGARPVGDASDVVAMMPRLDGPRAEDIPGRVLAALDAAARTADSIAERAGVSVPEVLAALLQLRWSGLALDAGGQRWRRAGSPPA